MMMMMMMMTRPLHTVVTTCFIIVIIILFESGNMAHTQTHKNIQTDRISKKSTIKHSKSHKNADGLTHRSSFTVMIFNFFF